MVTHHESSVDKENVDVPTGGNEENKLEPLPLTEAPAPKSGTDEPATKSTTDEPETRSVTATKSATDESETRSVTATKPVTDSTASKPAAVEGPPKPAPVWSAPTAAREDPTPKSIQVWGAPSSAQHGGQEEGEDSGAKGEDPSVSLAHYKLTHPHNKHLLTAVHRTSTLMLNSSLW